MPNRIIRDGILRSEKIAALSPHAELFYRRLMSVVDDFGRYYARLELLLSDCFPIRPEWADVEGVSRWLAECRLHHLVKVYVVNYISYLEIENFGQRVRPGQDSKFPEFRGNPPESAADFRESREFPAYARASTPTTPTASTTPPKAPTPEFSASPAVTDELFRGFLGIFLSLGVALSEADTRNCATYWVGISMDARGLAIVDAQEHAQGDWGRRTGEYIPRPWNYLKERMWERKAVVPARKSAMSKGDAATEEAIRMMKQPRSF